MIDLLNGVISMATEMSHVGGDDPVDRRFSDAAFNARLRELIALAGTASA